MGISPVSLGLVTSAHSIGCIAAFFPSPWVSERFGRRRAIQLGNIGMLAGFVGQVLSKNYTPFLICRMFVGFSSMFSTISSAALLIELALPRHRSIAGALFNTCWFIGSIACAWTSFFCLKIKVSDWSWKIPVAAQASWALAQLALIFLCPESPTWLVRHGQIDAARAILVKFHGNGNAEDTAVRDEFSQLVTLSQQTTSSHWSALYSTPGHRQRLLLSIIIGISTQWVGNGIISFYLAPILSTIGISSPLTQQSINGSLHIYTFFIAICSALLSNVFGRRRLFLTSTSIMLLFMVMVTICSALYSTTGHAAAGYAVIVFLFLFFGGYVIGLTPIPILYVNEIWPSHLRTKGTSVFWVSQAVAICFNQFVNPIALENIAWKYYLVYVGVLVAVIAFMFFCVPETKDLSLEEIGKMFDRRADGDEDVELAENTDGRGEREVRV
jgi:sugar porter (SP) family MFS transporter